LAQNALAYKTDVSGAAQIAAMLQLARHEFGALDILVANAGVQEDAPAGDMTLAQWNKVLSVNLTGQFLCARAAIQEFRHRGLRPDVSCALSKIICSASGDPLGRRRELCRIQRRYHDDDAQSCPGGGARADPRQCHCSGGHPHVHQSASLGNAGRRLLTLVPYGELVGRRISVGPSCGLLPTRRTM
jgi:NAD(P)-dependent dehydrogenase (short-subunit alcohol dehydrogenase family)